MESAMRMPQIPFTKTRLSNGLDVIVCRRPDLPVVSVNLWYHVGSKNEERSQRGFAHLFEHLMFEGSEHYPGDFFKPLQRLGASINGSTSTDRTNYFVDLPAGHLELALAMESDRMGFFLPALTDSKIRIQKDVVKNEYRQNYSNRPYGQVWRLLAEAMYPSDHPYSWLTIGLMEDVEAATRDEVESFFRRYYVPSNASLCLAGDLDELEALDLARRYFEPIPGGTRALPVRQGAIRPPEPVRLTYHDRVELDRVYRLWHTVPQFATDDAELVLAADVLARGRSSRLHQKLVVQHAVAQDVTAYHSGRELAGTFGVVVTARPGIDLARAEALFEDELRDLAEKGPTDEEFERVKNQRIAAFVYSLDNLGGFGGVADRLNAYNTYLGDPGRIETDLGRFLRATREGVMRVAKQYLIDQPSTTLEVLGRSHSRAPSVPVDRRVRPTPQVRAPFRAPVPEPVRLANGTELWVLHKPGLPIVAGTFVSMAGAGSHGPARAGLAGLTAAMLDEGTQTRTSEQIARETERLGTSLSTSAGWDGSYIGFQCLTPQLGRSLELALDVLLHPSFPEADWARIRAQALSALKAGIDSSEAQAHRAMLQTLYPADHPYSLPVDGTMRSVESLERRDLQAFHASVWPSRSAWVLAGDIDPGTAREHLERQLEGWGASAATPDSGFGQGPGFPAPGPLARRVVVVHRPGASQAVVRLGQAGIHRLNPDHDALLLWNQILGGQFSSRLNARLREEKGLTYGIRSHFDCRRHAGPFSVGASLQADRIGEALIDIRDEIDALLHERRPTVAELEDARQALIEGQVRHFETPASLVSRYAGLFLYGLPPDHSARLAERLAPQTPDSVSDAASRLLAPDQMVVIVVADADAVTPALEALGWGPVERREPTA